MRGLVAALFVCAWATAARGNEESAACGSRFIAVGERMEAVLEKCGPPTETRVLPPLPPSSWPRRPRGRAVIVEHWTYDLGPYTLVRHLRFEDRVLTRIELGDYGK